MTGPSLTSSTSIISPKRPVATFSIDLAGLGDKIFIPAQCVTARSRINERRPSAATRVAVKSKLRNHEHFAVDIGQRKIHLAVRVFKDPKLYDLVDQIVGVLLLSSLCVTPSRTSNPWPISPITSPSTVTFARETRWTTARITAASSI